MAIDTQDTLDVFGDGSCIALYRFNGDVTDLSGNYDGSDNGITYSAGVFGDAAHVESGKYIQVPIPGSISSNTWAVSFHINLIDPQNDMRPVDTLDEYGNNGLLIRIFYDGSGFRFSAIKDVSESYVDISHNFLNGWVHIVYMYDGTKASVYIDSINDNTKDIVKPGPIDFTKPCDVNIGTKDSGGGCKTPSNSSIYEIEQLRFFNRSLTQDEVDILLVEKVSTVAKSHSTITLSASSAASVKKPDTGFTFAYSIQQAIPVSNFRFAYGIQQSKSSKRIKRVT